MESKITERNYPDVLGRNPPDILYHYCSLDTFIHIIQDRTLWFSDVTKSNDSRELSWYQKFCTEKTKIMWINYLHKQGIDSVDVRQQKRFDAIVKMSESYETDPQFYVWALCLSELNDDLSQWRGYAKDGAGVAIGFNTEKLGRLFYSKQANEYTFNGVQKINYNAADKEQSNAITDVEKKLSRAPSIDAALNILNLAVSNAACDVYVYKNYSFHAEKEWRVVITRMKGEPLQQSSFDTGFDLEFNGIGYSERHGDLVSHATFHVRQMDEYIESICIGPKTNTSVEDVKDLLQQNGYMSNPNHQIVVTKSKSSYR